jgi:uncharacterized membrane protein YhaH (DUF805 family)
MSKASAQFFWPRGRISRTPYWAFGLLSNVALDVIQRTIPGAESSLWYGVISIIVTYIGSCLMIARLHDIDQSGWWALPLILAMAGFFVLFSFPATELNAIFWGSDALAWTAIATLFAVGIGGAFYVGLKPGNTGANRFGPSPFAAPA